jgi:hypothetical protein
MANTADIPQADLESIERLLSELFGDAYVGTYTLGKDGRSIQARVWVDGQPFLHVFERDAASGGYKVVAMHSLGRAKL